MAKIPGTARAFLVFYAVAAITPILAGPWAIQSRASVGPDRDAAMLIGAILVAVCAGALVLALLTLLRLRVHVRLVAGTARFDARELVTDYMGIARKVRGTVDGIGCLVTRDAIHVELGVAAAPFSDEALRFLAGRSDPTSEAARDLLASGCRSVVFAAKGTLVNGRPSGDLARVVRAAVVLARAQGAVVARAGGTCPYCKDELRGTEGVVRCPECGTAQHAECWREGGGCSIHGCERGRANRERKRELLA